MDLLLYTLHFHVELCRGRLLTTTVFRPAGAPNDSTWIVESPRTSLDGESHGSFLKDNYVRFLVERDFYKVRYFHTVMFCFVLYGSFIFRIHISRVFLGYFHITANISTHINLTKLWKLDFPAFFSNISKIFPYYGRDPKFRVECRITRAPSEWLCICSITHPIY